MTASVPRWSSAGLSAVWPTLAINHLTAHIDTLTTPIDPCRLNRQRDTLLDGLSLVGMLQVTLGSRSDSISYNADGRTVGSRAYADARPDLGPSRPRDPHGLENFGSCAIELTPH